MAHKNYDNTIGKLYILTLLTETIERARTPNSAVSCGWSQAGSDGSTKW